MKKPKERKVDSNRDEVELEKRKNNKEKESAGKKVVKLLREPILEIKRNITCDNFFSSVPLFDGMLLYKTTMVGILRANKEEIPPYFLEKKRKFHPFWF